MTIRDSSDSRLSNPRAENLKKTIQHPSPVIVVHKSSLLCKDLANRSGEFVGDSLDKLTDRGERIWLSQGCDLDANQICAGVFVKERFVIHLDVRKIEAATDARFVS
jgi:hypothetical protein